MSGYLLQEGHAATPGKDNSTLHRGQRAHIITSMRGTAFVFMSILLAVALLLGFAIGVIYESTFMNFQ